MVTIIFETHATSEDNETPVASGHYDSPLAPQGREEARQLGLRYTGVHLSAIFCSDLQRARRTAEIAFRDTGVPIIIDRRLREWDYGDWTRRPSKEAVVEMSCRITTAFPRGESFQQVATRVRSFLADLRDDHGGKKIMIIGHRATKYCLEYHINGFDPEKIATAPWEWQPGWIYTLGRI